MLRYFDRLSYNIGNNWCFLYVFFSFRLQWTTCNIKREETSVLVFKVKRVQGSVCVCVFLSVFRLLKLTILHKYFNCFFSYFLLFLKAIKLGQQSFKICHISRLCVCVCVFLYVCSCVWFLNLFIVEGNFCEYRPSPLISHVWVYGRVCFAAPVAFVLACNKALVCESLVRVFRKSRFLIEKP